MKIFRRPRRKPEMPTFAELWPKKFRQFTWVGPDDKKLASRVLDIVAKNPSTALDSEFPTIGPRKDEAIIWSLSGAPDQRFVLDGHWLKSKRSPFIEWIADKNTKLVYFSFPADADIIEHNAKIDAEPSFYADVKVEGWLRDNTKRRVALKEEGYDYLKWYRRDYHNTFGYVPEGKSKWITVPPNVIMEGPLPDEMLKVMSHQEWIKLFKHYAADDAEETHTLHRMHKVVLQKWNYWATYLTLDKPYTLVLRHFQKRGIPVDMDELRRLNVQITSDLMRHQMALRTRAENPTLNLDSQSKGLRKLVFEDWSFPQYDDLQTDGGAPQLNKVAWHRYATDKILHEPDWRRGRRQMFAELMLAHNKLKTKKNTFINGVTTGVKYGPGAATHTLLSEYNQTGTLSGRMSSRKFDVIIQVKKEYKRRPPIMVDKKIRAGMNMLNFPNKFNDPFGFRRVIVAPDADKDSPDGYELVVGDYSGFELWMILLWCHKWGIKSEMLQHLLAGRDVHAMTTVAVCELDCKWEDVKERYPALRNNEGKKSNFGLGYGAGPGVFAAILGLDLRYEKNIRKARRMIEIWNERWPEMAMYQRRCVEIGYKQGYVPTVAGRRIWVEQGLQSDDEATIRHFENLCKNGPAQGSAADITKMAQILIERDEQMRKLKYKQYFNVYDEILGSAPKRNADAATKRQDELMGEAGNHFDLPFPLAREVHHGRTWHDAK